MIFDSWKVVYLLTDEADNSCMHVPLCVILCSVCRIVRVEPWNAEQKVLLVHVCIHPCWGFFFSEEWIAADWDLKKHWVEENWCFKQIVGWRSRTCHHSGIWQTGRGKGRRWTDRLLWWPSRTFLNSWIFCLIFCAIQDWIRMLWGRCSRILVVLVRYVCKPLHGHTNVWQRQLRTKQKKQCRLVVNCEIYCDNMYMCMISEDWSATWATRRMMTSISEFLIILQNYSNLFPRTDWHEVIAYWHRVPVDLKCFHVIRCLAYVDPHRRSIRHFVPVQRIYADCAVWLRCVYCSVSHRHSQSQTTVCAPWRIQVRAFAPQIACLYACVQIQTTLPASA